MKISRVKNTQKFPFICAFAILTNAATNAPSIRADQTLANIPTGTNPVAVAISLPDERKPRQWI